MNRVRRSHGLVRGGGLWSMVVHGGPWTEARPELVDATTALSMPRLYQKEADVSVVLTKVFGDWLDDEVRPAVKRNEQQRWPSMWSEWRRGEVELDGENHCGANDRGGGAFYRAEESVEGWGCGRPV
jgi:hypothetical protein